MIYVNDNAFTVLGKIPKDSVNLILTDPPYIISRKTGFDSCVNGEERFRVNMEFPCDDNFTMEDMEAAVKEFYRILKPSGTCIIFFDLWKIESLKLCLEANGFSKIRLIEWIKTNPVPLNSGATYLNNAREIAISAIKGGKATFNSSYDPGIYKYPIVHGKERFHPNQKPIELGYELVNKHSNPGDTVLDPFAGSATFLIAAEQAGRNAIGCELDGEIYEQSIKRIEADILGSTIVKSI